jgi:hypothetical protein
MENKKKIIIDYKPTPFATNEKDIMFNVDEILFAAQEAFIQAKMEGDIDVTDCVLNIFELCLLMRRNRLQDEQKK